MLLLTNEFLSQLGIRALGDRLKILGRVSLIQKKEQEETKKCEIVRVVPIIRMFSVEKALEFYVTYLGFKVDWEHRFEEGLPMFMQVSRAGLIFHLSEHYGDGSPGCHFQIEYHGVKQLHTELSKKNYGYLRPGITETFWGTPELKLIDPFGNRFHFSEPRETVKKGESTE
jgi:uncharacterized glyoxalase superfamily protein PhnB